MSHIYLKADFQLISIAHRLQTVAYYDRIIVMVHGQIVESGTPLSLFEDTASLFRQMCDTKVRDPFILPFALADMLSEARHARYSQDSR